MLKEPSNFIIKTHNNFDKTNSIAQSRISSKINCMQTVSNDKASKTYTAYLVSDGTTKKFLKEPRHGAVTKDDWGPLSEAFVFASRRKATECACDINRRNDRSRKAFTIPVLMQKSS
jgi:hypothetical protein